MENKDFNNKPEIQETSSNSFFKAFGICVLSFALAVLTVVIISI